METIKNALNMALFYLKLMIIVPLLPVLGVGGLKEVTEKLAAKSKLVSQIFDEAGEDLDFAKVKCLEGDTTAKVEALKALDKEVTALTEQRKSLLALETGRERAKELMKEFNEPVGGMVHPSGKGTQQPQAKSIGEMFVAQGLNKKGASGFLDVDLKSIVQTGAGWAPFSDRLPRVELYPLRKLRVADIFPFYTTGNSDIKYMEETTHTNNAAEIAEETNAAAPTAYGEGAIAMTERSVPVEKIAIWIPVTEEQLEDVAGAGQFIQNRLTYMVENRMDSQLAVGDGNTPNLRGVNNAANIQSQAKGADPVLDAIFKGMTKVRGVSAGTGFAEPSAILMHPNDFEAVRLLRTADGIYIMGQPTEVGPERLWGVPLVVTSAQTENTAVVGDFANYAGHFVKRGITIEVTNSHSALFASGVLAIRATMRCAAVYFRGTAFCKVTGI